MEEQEGWLDMSVPSRVQKNGCQQKTQICMACETIDSWRIRSDLTAGLRHVDISFSLPERTLTRGLHQFHSLNAALASPTAGEWLTCIDHCAGATAGADSQQWPLRRLLPGQGPAGSPWRPARDRSGRTHRLLLPGKPTLMHSISSLENTSGSGAFCDLVSGCLLSTLTTHTIYAPKHVCMTYDTVCDASESL